MLLIEKCLLFLLIPALIFEHFIFFPKGNFTPLYGDVMLLVGFLLWKWRLPISRTLKSWSLSEFWKVVFLVYGMILFEEVFAALANHLSEGFSLPVLFIRITQFWAFNIIAFTGFAFGWALITRRFSFSMREVFWIFGLLGLFNEGMYKILLTNPLAFAIFGLPTVFIYGIISMPVAFALQNGGKKTFHWLPKGALTLVLIITLSIPCAVALQKLRVVYPAAFPSCEFISC